MAYKSGLSHDQQGAVLNKLAEIAQELNPEAARGMQKKAGLSLVDKERIVNSLLADPTGRGFKRVA